MYPLSKHAWWIIFNIYSFALESRANELVLGALVYNPQHSSSPTDLTDACSLKVALGLVSTLNPLAEYAVTHARSDESIAEKHVRISQKSPIL